MALLEVNSLRKTYRLGRVHVPVLKGVDLNVEKGEFVAILGASGSGKSTLLHLLGGLDQPDRVLPPKKGCCRYCRYDLQAVQGSVCPECGRAFKNNGEDQSKVLFDGRAVSAFSARELDDYRASSVGFVFQFYHLLPELSVIENVAIAAMVKHGRFGYPAAEVRARAEKLLDGFGLSHRLRHRPRELSGGERQRVAIARALINQPPVLLADEPTGNLDRTTGGAILDQILAARREHSLTLIMVTHDQEIAARADRVVKLVDGRVA